MVRLILLDTNVVLFPFEHSLDLVGELTRILDEKYEMGILDKCIEELDKKVIKKSLKERRAAKLALLWVQRTRVKVINSDFNLSADDAIIKYASLYKGPIAVATQDQALKRKLKELGIDRIVVRQKMYLELQV